MLRFLFLVCSGVSVLSLASCATGDPDGKPKRPEDIEILKC